MQVKEAPIPILRNMRIMQHTGRGTHKTSYRLLKVDLYEE